MTESFLNDRRVVYFGTPNTSAEILDHLCENRVDVGLVVTRPDTRRGRGSQMVPSPVKETAQQRGIPVTDDLESIMTLEPGRWLGVVVAYGRIIPQRILDRVPMINVHYSLLPRWRGAAPVERAILSGDETTGVCIMDLVAELDAGAVRGCREVSIGEKSAHDLLRELTREGAELLVEILRNSPEEPTPQTGEVTYAHKIEPHEAAIDWGQTREQIWRHVRALRAHTTCVGGRLDGLRLGISAVEVVPRTDESIIENDRDPSASLRSRIGHCDREGYVTCGDGRVRLVTVGPQGKKMMSATDWIRGLQGVSEISFR